MVDIECQAAAQTKSMATLGAYHLMNSAWANQVVAELNGLELVKKKGEQALIVLRRESPVLNLENGVGRLKGLLLLLL